MKHYPLFSRGFAAWTGARSRRVLAGWLTLCLAGFPSLTQAAPQAQSTTGRIAPPPVSAPLDWTAENFDLVAASPAQIEAVLVEGLKPTHLDSHCGTHTRREDIFDMTVQLAREYGLALRVSERPLIEKLQRQGYASNDYDILDSSRLETEAKPVLYPKLLRELPAGLSEWAIHPGIGNAELQAINPTWPVRQADYDFFTSSEAQIIIKEEGIILLNYKPFQELWRKKS